MHVDLWCLVCVEPGLWLATWYIYGSPKCCEVSCIAYTVHYVLGVHERIVLIVLYGESKVFSHEKPQTDEIFNFYKMVENDASETRNDFYEGLHVKHPFMLE